MSLLEKPPRDHHFVVRSYLEFFEAGVPRMVEVTDVEEARVWRSTAKETGFERDLYRLPSATPENEFTLETKALQAVETNGIPILRVMNETRTLPVGADYAHLVLFISTQAMRTPAFLDWIGEVSLAVYQKEFRRIASSDEEWKKFSGGPGGPFLEVSREEMRAINLVDHVKASPEWKLHLAFRFAAAPECPMFFHKRHWSLYASDGREFITSDNPVIHAKDWTMFPIGPNAVLLGQMAGPRAVYPIGDVAVSLFNRATLANAKRRIYSSTRSSDWFAVGSRPKDLAAYRGALRNRQEPYPSLAGFRP